MIYLSRRILHPVLICMLCFPIYAQSTNQIPLAFQIDALLEEALNLAASNAWEQALSTLEEAEKIAPEDARIESYRLSIQELMHLNEVKKIENATEALVIDSESDVPPEEETAPKFVIERSDRTTRLDPGQSRDQFHGVISIQFVALDPINVDDVSTFPKMDDFFYSSLGIDLRYWTPLLKRSLGLSMLSEGYALPLNNPIRLLNILSLGISLRGFLLERTTSRMELGIDFGAGLYSRKEISTEKQDYSSALYLGIWISDPIFYHLFNADILERLIFSGGLRIYTITNQEALETINYHIEVEWRFEHVTVGLQFKWWDLNINSSLGNIAKFSIYSGFYF